ncbi:hypothetical protein RYX36_023234 [Vicia faba]
MDNLRQRVGNFSIVALLFVGFIFIFIYNGSFSSSSNQLLQSHKSTNINEAYKDGLETALGKASKGNNKTLIIAFVNKAYVEQDVNDDPITMFDLFLSSFWLGQETRSLIDNLLIVAVDQTAYDRCMFLRLNCFRLETDGVDFEGEKLYMSQDFIMMMWKRTYFLLQVLKRHYNFIFTDSDVMWLRNPFKKLSMERDEDIQISTDEYNGDPWSENNKINTGFYFVRSNNKTISLFETWYKNKDNSTEKKEQDVLQDLIKGGIFKHLKLKVRFLDTLYFSGFCQDSKDFRVITTVHANCCRSIIAKVADLKTTLRDWKQFKKLEVNSTTNIHWSSHKKCLQSWKS